MFSSIFVLGTFACAAFAQVITFSNTTFTLPVTVGSVWDVSYSAGDGGPVAIVFGNSSTQFVVVDGLSAPGNYPWNVAVPVGYASGMYQLALVQGNDAPVFSPLFQLDVSSGGAPITANSPSTAVPFPATVTTTTTATTTVTAYFLPYTALPNVTMPQVTYIYYEEECGCHKTSSCDYSAMPTSMSTTQYTYVADECGCTRTITASCAPTAIPVSPVATTTTPGATNTPVAPTVAPAAATTNPVAPAAITTPASYTGGAYKLAGSSFGLVALIAVIFA